MPFSGFTESSVLLFPLFQWNLSYTLMDNMSYISFSWKGVINITQSFIDTGMDSIGLSEISIVWFYLHLKLQLDYCL